MPKVNYSWEKVNIFIVKYKFHYITSNRFPNLRIKQQVDLPNLCIRRKLPINNYWNHVVSPVSLIAIDFMHDFAEDTKLVKSGLDFKLKNLLGKPIIIHPGDLNWGKKKLQIKVHSVINK